MSLQYTHDQNSPLAVPRELSVPSSQIYSQCRDARHAAPVKQDVRSVGCSSGNTNSPVSSLSPPLSSVTSDVLSHSNLEYLCDSCSCGRDYSSCSQADRCNEFASHPSYGGSTQSIAVRHVQTPSLDACVSFSSERKSMTRALAELESALLGPDEDGDLHEFAGENTSFWTDLLDEVPQSNTLSDAKCALLHPSFLVHDLEGMNLNQKSRTRTLLVMCAFAINEGKMEMADAVMQELRKEVSVFGDPIQRLGAYMCEGLVARLHSSGFALYQVLKCMEAPKADVLAAMQKLYEICPYFKFAYMAATGAIAEAFKNEAKVHIFDFQIAQGTQWISLLQGLANRPGGPPCVRITTVEDTSAQGYPIGGMQLVRQRLCKLAVSLNVPFEFNTIPCKLSELQAHMIERKEGEALAVNFTLQLHHLPDESVSITNPRDRLLQTMKGLNPKVLTVVEQEANTNTAPFFQRFVEVLDFYSSMFESIDVALPRDSNDRVNVEQQCLARDIVNVIACEGADRIERHELTGKWRVRMSMAGFRPHPLSAHVNDTIKMLLKSYSENYKLKEEGEALFLGWMDRSLVVASAWH